ncbi:DUF262 domain-containing protein [Roseomonas nepalensis]|uniref:DUF262 domain-containing protein n=1 Tax=Muricoccus nepalensis TaxID=1854500 RepID=A0A502G155_9PROT|nr:DUF262 domain-containing protein [Roseomonas nepalensis]TPG55474.1 DUF262 domain-containing protein [Roseomonas nepalensis]
MKSDTVSVRSLFKVSRRYVVPIYQRHYVWSREGQWEGLWEDILAKATQRLGGVEKRYPHYMGAVVLNSREAGSSREVPICEVIDGQQRLTTLQILFCTLRDVALVNDLASLSRLADRNTTNPDAEDMKSPEVDAHRLWPTHHDRDTYLQIQSARSREEIRKRFREHFPQNSVQLKKINLRQQPNLLKAYIFFYDAIRGFVGEGADVEAKLDALLVAVLDDFRLVEIQLQTDDDPQTIFETLNDRGKPLLAFDLIRNFIFMRAARTAVGTSAEKLYDNKWTPLEADFWTEDEQRGRLKRPRVEFFMLQYLTARSGKEISLAQLFAEYRDFLRTDHAPKGVEAEVEDILHYADLYKQIVRADGEDALGRAARRLKPWDITTVYAPILAIASSDVGENEKEQAYQDIVSYVVRRAIVGGSAANYNRIFLGLAREIVQHGASADLVRTYLLSQGGSSSTWPSDAEFRHHWLSANLYARLRPPVRMISVLSEIETALRGPKTDPVPIPSHVWIEHLMPQGWHTNWPLPDGSKVTWQEIHEVDQLGDGGRAALREQVKTSPAGAETPSTVRARRLLAIARRAALLQTIGNLTLHTRELGWELSNKSFADKQALFRKHGLLQVTQGFMGEDATAWDEEAIQRRGAFLFDNARQIWAYPVTAPAQQQAAE